VGIELPTVEVRFEQLNVQAKCHVGSRALPTLLNTARNVAESALGLCGVRLGRQATLTILKDVSGVVRPSRMTLLLGPPSSGKTTLLLALAGKLDPTLRRTGEITYNGFRLDEFVPQKTAAYISQTDVHVGEMTVKETLDFSARCQGVGTKYDLMTELARREKEAGIRPEPEVDLFMKVRTNMHGLLFISTKTANLSRAAAHPLRKSHMKQLQKRFSCGVQIMVPTSGALLLLQTTESFRV
jgi:ABC-type sugar transport system ATPase subunit